jgi:hypothetical protein
MKGGPKYENPFTNSNKTHIYFETKHIWHYFRLNSREEDAVITEEEKEYFKTL